MPISLLIPKARALNTNLNTTGGITVIRKLNLKGRAALVTSILLMALWAPITTTAQPNAEPESGKYAETTDVHKCAHCKLLHSAKGLPCPHAHQHSNSDNTDFESMVGFAEVDPAAHLFESMATGVVASSHEVSGDYVGFAEADPTDFGTPFISVNRQLSERSTWQNPVGFAETDPAEIEGGLMEIPNEILVACQHMGTSSSHPSAIEFSGVSNREDHS